MLSSLYFALAALCEIAGCFSFWAWLRHGRSAWWLAPGVRVLGPLCRAAHTRGERDRRPRLSCVRRHLHCRFAPLALGVEGKLPDRYDLLGAVLCLGRGGEALVTKLLFRHALALRNSVSRRLWRMRSRYQFNEPHSAHFITSTMIQWLPVLTTAACCDIVVQALLYGRAQRGLLIHAWVIMDNHFHAIVSGPDLAGTIGNLKKFTAKCLLE
jgi:drug/metabolite transporter superfamily protein YnfA